MKMKSLIGSFVRPLAVAMLALSALCSCAVDGLEQPSNDAAEKLVANYKVYGNVADADGTPVQGIRIIADHGSGSDTLYTDREGRFSKFLTLPNVKAFLITVDDIDGPANGGSFESVSEYVTPSLTEMSVGGFGGSYIVFLDVKLVRRK